MTDGPHQQRVEAAPVRRPLFRRIAAFLITIVFVALLADGGLEAWFSYDEHKAALAGAQQQSAARAADAIGQFIKEIEADLGWTAQLPLSSDTLEAKRFDAQRLLRQAPAITELALIDAEGREQLRVSRVAIDQLRTGKDFSRDPAFTRADSGSVYLGPVYFKDSSEPYMTIALAGARRVNGVSVAEVNLKFIQDVIAGIKIGQRGYAYIVDGAGRLIAHPDITLVLRNYDVSDRPQVRLARERIGGMPQATATTNFTGERVLSAFAPIPSTGWLVFVETPIAEAFQPLYTSLKRAALVLACALCLAVGASFLFAHRMIAPIKTLQAGADRLGGGDLAHRISVHTEDEVEALARSFNDMADRLETSYTGLESKVEARTRELAEKGRELEAASRHKSQFLANMSHELRTPLNSVLGFSEMLADGIYGALPERALAALSKIQTNGRHLLNLINDVLDLSKIEAGQLVLSPNDYVMGEIVQSVLASVETQACAKGVLLTTSVAPGLPVGFGDERRITQVLLNLVSNAMKFTDQGSVTIAVAASQGTFRVSVSDTGPGIAPADQERIFGEFQQVDSSSTRGKGGTGLGLAISRRIAEMHGGRITVESALGTGSTFHMTIPVRIDAAKRAA
jgi:signal transduction histidine kinase